MDGVLKVPARSLPIRYKYDVAVVGGGIAGVAAAVAAARQGASVILLEKEISLGGLATVGNVIVYLPLCDGMGRQLIGGLGEELLKLSINDNRGTPPALNDDCSKIPECWLPGGDKEERSKKRYQVHFNPASYLLALESVVLESGVKLLYDVRFCGVMKSRDKITHLLVADKSGLSLAACGAVVDASGDADVCHAAGEDTESLSDNVRAGWFYYTEDGLFKLEYLSDVFPARNKFIYSSDNAEGVTAQVLATRDMMRSKIAERRKEKPDSSIYPAMLPSIACFRMTRRLRSDFEPDSPDAQEFVADCIGLTGDWRKNGPTYHLSFRSLAAVKCPNLITAGRCISVKGDFWDVTRVIPACAVTGEAAGTAAAMLCKGAGRSFRTLPIPELQAALSKSGVILPG